MKQSYEVTLQGDYYCDVMVQLQSTGFPPHYIEVDGVKAERVGNRHEGHRYALSKVPHED